MFPSLAQLSLTELEESLAAEGFKRSHAARLLRAFYAGDGRFDEVGLLLPQGLTEQLRAKLRLQDISVAARQVAEDGTTKLLLRLHDGRTIETVMMPDYRGERVAGCVSS